MASNRLGQSLSFFPGAYSVQVNKATMPATVEAGRTNGFQTGTLTVKGNGKEYYFVLDPNGTQLGSNQINKPLSLPSGKYSVRVGKDVRPLAISASQATVIKLVAENCRPGDSSPFSATPPSLPARSAPPKPGSGEMSPGLCSVLHLPLSIADGASERQHHPSTILRYPTIDPRSGTCQLSDVSKP